MGWGEQEKKQGNQKNVGIKMLGNLWEKCHFKCHVGNIQHYTVMSLYFFYVYVLKEPLGQIICFLTYKEQKGFGNLLILLSVCEITLRS